MQEFSSFFDSWVREYYKSANIGKNGDFYTAASTSVFFGGAIAQYIIKCLESGKLTLPLNIIDVGGNDGKLLKDVYDFLCALSIGVVEKSKFILVESNRLDSTILESSFIKVKDFSSLRLESNCFFIANELFDAMPCELYNMGKMAFVDDDYSIVFKEASLEINEVAKRFDIKKGEIPLSYFRFCDVLRGLKAKFMFLTCDYGKWENVDEFSLRIFLKHKISNFFEVDLKEYFGISDITYNVPFKVLDSAFSNIGAKKILCKRQDLALIDDFKILDLFQQFYDDKKTLNMPYIRESNKLKTLLYNLSENFKIVIYCNF